MSLSFVITVSDFWTLVTTVLLKTAKGPASGRRSSEQ
jgi:hypothetical protein